MRRFILLAGFVVFGCSSTNAPSIDGGTSPLSDAGGGPADAGVDAGHVSTDAGEPAPTDAGSTTPDAGASATDAGASTPTDAGFDGGGVTCGNTVCGADEECCSPSCGICGVIGGACPDIECVDAGTPDAGGSEPTDAGFDGGGVACGNTICGPGEQCCSPSCSICGTIGGACPAIACADAGTQGVDCGDAGSCGSDEVCFAVTDCSGVAGRPCALSWSCDTVTGCAPSDCACLTGSGATDPCAHSQMCEVDAGTVSCAFDHP